MSLREGIKRTPRWFATPADQPFASRHCSVWHWSGKCPACFIEPAIAEISSLAPGRLQCDLRQVQPVKYRCGCLHHGKTSLDPGCARSSQAETTEVEQRTCRTVAFDKCEYRRSSSSRLTPRSPSTRPCGLSESVSSISAPAISALSKLVPATPHHENMRYGYRPD
jgi:hypothetical protein